MHLFQFSKGMLTSVEVDTNELSELMKSLNDSNRDQWIENVKDTLTMVSKCLNGERFVEAAQLVFAVIKKSLIKIIF